MTSIYQVTREGGELYSGRFFEILDKINNTVKDFGEDLEGNLFYFHKSVDFVGAPPNPGRAHKRRNFERALRGKSSVLELGFNAGHSALLALSINENIKYVGVDICKNKYTQACSEVLKEAFGERFKFIKGDSRDVLAALAIQHPDSHFDVIHIDGGHSSDNCRTDISNSLRLASPNTRILLDDTAHKWIRDVLDEFLSRGLVRIQDLSGEWEKEENILLDVCADKAKGEISTGKLYKRAIVYVAWGEKFIWEAVASAESAEFLGIDRILITNENSKIFLPDNSPFKQVICHEFLLSGNRSKIEMIDVLPEEYESFLFLDTDTRILLDITQGFERSEAYGIAAAQAAHYSLEHFWGVEKFLDKFGFVSNEILQYNSGVIFFTRNPAAWAVMKKYRDICFEVDTSYDQPFFTLAMELLNFNPYTLSIAYNYRNLGELVSGRIRIWHSHLPPPPDVNDFAKPWPPRRFRKGVRLEDSG